MTKFSRRQFTTGLAAGSAILAAPSIAFGARARVVVVGGGAGGATAAPRGLQPGAAALSWAGAGTCLHNGPRARLSENSVTTRAFLDSRWAHADAGTR